MIFVFIINPLAGKGNATAWLAPRIGAAFADAPEQCEVYVTQAPGDATAFVQRRCQAAAPDEQLCFVGCGGDGTAAEVAAGIADHPTACMGLAPCGTGNDFVKSFPGRDFLDFAALRQGELHAVDLIRCNGRLALNVCNAGLDADVARDISTFKRLPLMGGPAAYLVSLCKNFFGRLGCAATVWCDGVPEPTRELMLLVAANGRYYGGSFMGAPEAVTDDGLLDLSIVPKLSRPRILSVLPRYQKGRHTTDPDLRELVSYRQCRRVRVEYAHPVTLCLDGETTLTDVLEAEILPGALRLWLPRSPAQVALDLPTASAVL